MIPPRTSASSLVTFTVLAVIGVYLAWQTRFIYLDDLDRLVNDIATRYHLVPTG